MKNLGIRRCDRVRLDDLQNPRKEKVCERKSTRREGGGGKSGGRASERRREVGREIETERKRRNVCERKS